MDKLKLKWKLFGFLIAFSGLLLATLWLFQTVWLDEMYKFVRRREIDAAVRLVSARIEEDDLESVLLELERTKEITVRPTNDFSQPLPSLPGPGGQREPESLTRVETYTLADGRTISVTFYALISPVSATVRTLRLQLYIITFLMILLAILLALVIARHIARPIERMNQRAKTLARANYEPDFSATGFREIRELGDTLNQAAIDLSQVERTRRELIANVSHDLRTPLALIYSYAELMHDFPDEVTPEQSRIIMAEASRLTELVSDMLDSASLEAGTVHLNKTRFDLAKLCHSIVHRMNELLKPEGYTILFEDQAPEEIEADRSKLTQVIYNLILNAAAHSPANEAIRVRLQSEGDFVLLTVIDRGEGISAEDLPLIWERYYKVDRHSGQRQHGTGLGLSIVKRIVDLHGGCVEAVSVEGQGSCFTIRLPRRDSGSMA